MATDFPDDDNGRVLREMAEHGVDLTLLRTVDFEHCFPDEVSARSFRDSVRASVSEAILYEPDPAAGRGWEVQCRQRLIPTYRAITDAEEGLGAVARAHGGYADGWGSLSNPDGTPAD